MLISEIKRRFSDKNVELLKSIHACSPDSENFLQPEALIPLATFYDLDLHTLQMEATLAKRSIEEKVMENITDVLVELSPLKNAFPTLVKLLKISLSISVSTVKCERCFSALKRIKTYLRSTL